jgi:hypothetical protein
MFKISLNIFKIFIKEDYYISKNIFINHKFKSSYVKFSKIKNQEIFKRNNINYFIFNNYSDISKMEIEDKKKESININTQNKKVTYDEYDDFSDSENNEEFEIAEGIIKQNMPKKSKYRTRAHINPLSEITVK